MLCCSLIAIAIANLLALAGIRWRAVEACGKISIALPNAFFTALIIATGVAGLIAMAMLGFHSKIEPGAVVLANHWNHICHTFAN
jgi:hypothetical protein